jgi:hypothetical protein
VTTTTADSLDTSTCPAWCAGVDWHGTDEAGGDWHEAHPGAVLHLRGLTAPPIVDPDYQGVSVHITQRVEAGAEPVIGLNCRRDDDNALAMVDLTPVQAARLASMLAEAVSQAL